MYNIKSCVILHIIYSVQLFDHRFWHCGCRLQTNCNNVLGEYTFWSRKKNKTTHTASCLWIIQTKIIIHQRSFLSNNNNNNMVIMIIAADIRGRVIYHYIYDADSFDSSCSGCTSLPNHNIVITFSEVVI